MPMQAIYDADGYPTGESYWVDDPTTANVSSEAAVGPQPGETRQRWLPDGTYILEMWMPAGQDTEGNPIEAGWERISPGTRPPSGGAGAVDHGSVVKVDSNTYPGWDVITYADGFQDVAASQAPAPTTTPTPVTGVNTIPIPGTKSVVVTDQAGNPMGTATVDDPAITSLTAKPIPGTNEMALYDQDGNFYKTAPAATKEPTPITGVKTLPVPGTKSVVVTDQDGNFMGMGTTDDPSVTSITAVAIPGTDMMAQYDQDGRWIGNVAAAEKPVTGDLIPTPTPGFFINPNTGVQIDLRDPYVQKYGELPSNLAPIKDPQGNIISWTEKPALPGTQLVADPKMPGLYMVKDAEGNIVDVGGTYDPNNDRDFLEKVRQFDATLAVDIQRLQNSLQIAQMQEAGASARQAEALKAQAANLKAELASRMAIATKEIAGRWRQSVLGAATDVRGQDVAMRGQDVSREANILQAMQARSQYGIEVLKNDPVAQAMYTYGQDPSAQMTPAKYLLNQFQIPSLPSIGKVGALNPNVAKGFRGGGVVRSNEPVLSIVGESHPSAAEAALLPPGSAIEPLRLPKNATKADMERAALRAYPRLQKRLASFQEGGAVTDPYDYASMFQRSTNTPYGNDVVTATVPTATPTAPAPARPVTTSAPPRPTMESLRATMGRAASPGALSLAQQEWDKLYGSTAAPAPALPAPTPAPTPIPLNPEDALLFGQGGSGGYTGGSTFTNPADLATARQTFADLLTKAMAGTTMPAAGALPKPESIYGVDLTQPEQLAARFWNMPTAARQLTTSAWGVRNMPEAEFYRRMGVVTPSAMRPFNVGWGQRGMAVLPTYRRIAA